MSVDFLTFPEFYKEKIMSVEKGLYGSKSDEIRRLQTIFLDSILEFFKVFHIIPKLPNSTFADLTQYL